MEKSKVFRSFALTAILTGSILLAACGQTPPESENPDTSQNQPSQETPAKIALQKRAEEYENFILDLKSATSLTAEESNQKVELQENKLKLTQGSAPRYVETVEGESFEYVFDGGGYTKNPYTGDMTAASYKASLLLTVDVEGWTEVDAQGKLTKTGYSADFNTENKTLSFSSPEHTITIYDVGQTQVTLPEVKDPVQEGFKITEENIEQIKEAFIPHIEVMDLMTTMTHEDIKSIYLKKSEGSQFVDTIGAVYTAKSQRGNTFFYWNEMKIPTQEDLTYERFYKNQVPADYKLSTVAKTFEQKYYFSCQNENNYAEMTETLKSQTFKEDYTNCQWSGWKYTQGMSSDAHVIACYNNGRIEEKTLRIKKDNSNMNVTLAVDKNFKDKEESESTYQTIDSKTLQVESEDKQFLVVEEPSKQQDIENVG